MNYQYHNVRAPFCLIRRSRYELRALLNSRSENPSVAAAPRSSPESLRREKICHDAGNGGDIQNFGVHKSSREDNFKEAFSSLSELSRCLVDSFHYPLAILSGHCPHSLAGAAAAEKTAEHSQRSEASLSTPWTRAC